MLAFRRSCLAIVVAAAWALPAVAADKIMPDLFFKITPSVVTPHVEWAKPYCRGKVRASVLAPRFAQRETIELMERMDIDCKAVLLRSQEEIYLSGWDWGLENEPRAKKDAVLKEINDALSENYDLMILGDVPTGKLPKEILAKIEDKIRKGCGLLQVRWPRQDADFEKEVFQAAIPAVPRAIADGTAFEKLEGFGVRGDANRQKDVERAIHAYQYGNGRVVRLSYPAGSVSHYLTPPDKDDLSYEYYQALAIKAVLGGQEGAPAALPRVSRGDPGRRVDDRPGRRGGRVGGQGAFAGVLPAEPATAPADARPSAHRRRPEADRGVHPAGIRADRRPFAGAEQGGAEDSRGAGGDLFRRREAPGRRKERELGGGNLQVDPRAFISALECSPETIDCSRPAKAALRLNARLNAKTKGGAAVHFALLDNFDRLLAQKRIPLAGGAESAAGVLEIDPAAVASALLRVRAALSVGRRETSVQVANVTTIGRPFPDFSFFAWGSGTGDYVSRQSLRVHAATGIVDAYRTFGTIAALDVADARFVPDMLRLFGALQKPEGGVMRPTPLWGDPGYRRQLFSTVKTFVEGGLKFDTYAYLLGDEMSMLNGGGDGTAVCVGRTADFRAYLQRQYGSIEALNKQWGTGYKGFEEINPVGAATVNNKARQDGNYSPLIDNWAFNYWAYADTVRFIKEVQRGVDPRARLGASTPLWNFGFRGYYWEKIAPHLDFYTPYYSTVEGDLSTVECGMAFAAPGATFSGHAGSYITTLPNEEYYTVLPHSMLLKGMSNLFWYHLNLGAEGCMSPSFDYYPQTQRAFAEVKRIKAGLGRLILGSQKAKRKIAILYSTPSHVFSFVAVGPQLPWNFNAVCSAVHRLGYQAAIVSPAEVAAGKLADYQVLLLPVCQCLGDDEAEKIRRFAAGGGVVIADVRPGVADVHGRYRKDSPLADLFGVHWNNAATTPLRSLQLAATDKTPELSIDLRLDGKYEGIAFSTPPLAALGYDPAVVPAGAKPAVACSLPKDKVQKMKQWLAGGGAPLKKLTPQDAKALQERIEQLLSAPENVPLVLVNKCGQGSAVCLNAAFSGFPGLNDILGAVLASRGIKPGVTVIQGAGGGQPGRWIPNFCCDAFTDGDARYFGFVKQKNPEMDEGSKAYYGVTGDAHGGPRQEAAAKYHVAFDLGGEGHVYEPMTGSYLGVRNNVSAAFGPWAARWYAVLPYRVEALKVSLRQPPKPGAAIQGSAEIVVHGPAKIQRHVVNVQVLDKEGRSIMYLLRNLDTLQGKAQFSIPTALNDGVHTWTLVLTDAATGVSAKIKL